MTTEITETNILITTPLRSHMRHTLLTPVTAIIGYSEMLVEELENSGLEDEFYKTELDEIVVAGKKLYSSIVEVCSPACISDGTFDDLTRILADKLYSDLKLLIGNCEILQKIPEPSQTYGNSFLSDLEKIKVASINLLKMVIKPRNLLTDQEEEETDNLPESMPIDAVKTKKIPMTIGGGKILIVDDNESNQALIIRNLERYGGYEILTANDGLSGWNLVRSTEFDLVLMDMKMPNMNGYEVLCKMKAEPELSNIPVIMISAQGEIADVEKCIKKGADDYLLKPFNLVVLKARIDACLEKKFAHDREMEFLQQLKNNNDEIRSLLRIMSHDIVNQVSAVEGYIELYEIFSANSPDRAAEMVKNMKRPLMHVSELIGAVRQMRQFEDGKSELQFFDYQVEQIKPAIEETFNKRLYDKNIQITIAPEPIPGDWKVSIIPAFFNQTVINNVISNAIKFSHPGSEINISLKRGKNSTKIIVEDRGIGIPPIILQNLFRTDIPTTRAGTCDEAGTGFGMPLVKKYIEVMGGSIDVASVEKTPDSEGHGTTVTLTVPNCKC